MPTIFPFAIDVNPNWFNQGNLIHSPFDMNSHYIIKENISYLTNEHSYSMSNNNNNKSISWK